ncbi:MAG: cytochrome c [Verrucomicrobia bacterium]|nr:cytochrome c [Verrucomicrobiota bacterium]
MNASILKYPWFKRQLERATARALRPPTRASRLPARSGPRRGGSWVGRWPTGAALVWVAGILFDPTAIRLCGADPRLLASVTAGSAPVPHATAPQPTYLRDVLPIFMGKCATCHNAQSSIYNWMDYPTAYEHRWEIKRRVWDSWHGSYYKQPMPAGNTAECLSMTEADRALIKAWVEDGALRGSLPASGGFASETARLEHGKQLFTTICALCHQPDGRGIAGKFPPLAGSDFLNADKDRAIKTVLNGRQGEILVNGQTFNNSMPSFPLSDEDIAAALTYVYHSFGNSGQLVSATEVKTLRGQKDDQPVSSPASAVAKAPPEKNPYE